MSDFEKNIKEDENISKDFKNVFDTGDYRIDEPEYETTGEIFIDEHGRVLRIKVHGIIVNFKLFYIFPLKSKVFVEQGKIKSIDY